MIHSELLRRFAAYLCASATLAALPSSGMSQTVSYQYDELGRLKATSQSGGTASGVATSVAYDAAGNRTNYTVSGSSGSSGGSTGGGSTGGGGTTTNNPPVANSDSMSMYACAVATKNVTANDTDPEGDLPLTVTAATSNSIYVEVASASSVTVHSDSTAGTKSVTYTIQDSRGATASGTLTVSVIARVCE